MLRWVPPVFLMEVRRIFAYRAAFWIDFAAVFFVQLLAAWCLWGAIYSANDVEALAGYSFHGMLYYYVLAALLMRLLQGEGFAELAQEIYTGAFTRYLVYPVPLLGYRLVVYAAQFSLQLLRLLLALLVLRLIFPLPSELAIDADSLARGLMLAAAGAAGYFFYLLIVELVAFWAENVWALVVCARFFASILGGAILPLALFPEPLQPVLQALPFQYFVYLPVRALIGELSWEQTLVATASALGWAVVLAGIAVLVFARGRRRYTGVGI